MSVNETTVVNGTQTVSSCFNYEALKIAYIAAFFPVFLVSLVGNIFIGIIVYKTKSLKKPVNYFIANMAMSDLVYPISMLTRDVASLFISDSWLFSGPLGQALCKLVSFSIEVSTLVSSQSLVLIAVDRFGAVVFFPSVPHWSVQTSAASSFSPLGSLPWSSGARFCSSLKFWRIQTGRNVRRFGLPTSNTTLWQWSLSVFMSH